jgi:hypothetical protein
MDDYLKAEKSFDLDTFLASHAQPGRVIEANRQFPPLALKRSSARLRNGLLNELERKSLPSVQNGGFALKPKFEGLLPARR